jgi:hypothetical protein
LTAEEAEYLRECGDVMPNATDRRNSEREMVVSRSLERRGLVRDVDPGPEYDFTFDVITPLGRIALECYVAATSGLVAT